MFPSRKTTGEQDNLSCNSQAALAILLIISTYTGSYSLLTDGEEDDKHSVTKTVVILNVLEKGHNLRT